ncbi:MAG TPA: hypothetical protein VG297_21705, partial [Bryobacteraceae bacterium]|nr:hypothetical protein [Bryobacteraceae bacterium]
MDDVQEVSLSPDVVAFALEVFAGRFPFLGFDFLLLLPNPCQLRNREDADGIEIHARRRGDPDLTDRRVNAQMDVFDVLAGDVDGHVAELQRVLKHFTRSA